MESPAFAEFKESVKVVLAILKNERDRARRPAVQNKQEQGGMFSRLSIDPLRAYASSTYASDEKLKGLLEEFGTALSSEVEGARVVLARYRRLATLGTLIDVVLPKGETRLALFDMLSKCHASGFYESRMR